MLSNLFPKVNLENVLFPDFKDTVENHKEIYIPKEKNV